jgi:hypothetical protein
MSEEPIQPFAGHFHPVQESWVAEQAGRRKWTAGDPEEDRAAQCLVKDPADRRKAPTRPELESPAARDRGDAPESPAPEEVGQVSDLQAFGTRSTGECTDGKSARGRSRRAHAESLPDRELMGKVERECTVPFAEHSAGDLLRDRKGRPDVARNSHLSLASGPERGVRVDAEFEGDPRSAGPAGARVAGVDDRDKNPGDVGRRERVGASSPGFAHEIPSRRGFGTTAYKRGTLCQSLETAVPSRYVQR